MVRESLTDEPLDDLANDMRDLRLELKAELAELRQWMFRMTIGMTVGFISILAAIIARGA
jgi:hypothetical protein